MLFQTSAVAAGVVVMGTFGVDDVAVGLGAVKNTVGVVPVISSACYVHIQDAAELWSCEGCCECAAGGDAVGTVAKVAEVFGCCCCDFLNCEGCAVGKVAANAVAVQLVLVLLACAVAVQ